MNIHARSDGKTAACNYCGLPLVPGDGVESSAPVYCCSGCRFAESVAGAGEQGRINSTLARTGIAVFFSMNVMMFSIALWPQDLSGAGVTDRELAPLFWSLFRIVCLLFTAPVICLLLIPLIESGSERARQRIFGSDLLLAAGVIAAFVYSCINVVRDQGDVYFDVVCMVLVAVTLGRWIEARGRFQAAAAVKSLARLLPDDAIVVRDGVELRVPRAHVAIGERVCVCPGATVPVDGELIGPECEVDESILTGESLPAPKRPGDTLFAGSIALVSGIELRASAVSNEAAVERMAECVRRACEQKGRYQRLADKISAMFLPAVGAIALAAFVINASIDGALSVILRALAVLVAACPCALGLATPMAIWATLGNAASHCIHFRSGDAIERMAEARAVRIDKTGTLTEGHRVLEAVFSPELERPRLLAMAAALARHSLHPAAAAVADFGGPAKPESDIDSANIVEMPGLGLEARDARGEQILLGSERFLLSRGCAWRSDEMHSRFRTAVDAGFVVVCLGGEGQIRGFFLIEEGIKPEATAVINRLKQLGFDVAVLTGDNAERSGRLAARLGVPVAAGLTPEEKVRELSNAAVEHGPVIMVGDGVNDAPALAASHVGVALGHGADLARLVADICLLGNSLEKLVDAVRLARSTVRIIRQNLFWAFVYNVVAIAFAVSGRLDPIKAAAAMVLSSLFVSMNSLRLRGGDATTTNAVEPGPRATCSSATATTAAVGVG